ncbi:MAG: glucose-inhibited division protein A [Lentisphaerae bacterium RIFOXYB12_FULL_65_16]|nr:MAG: glucose-inhibited division protein A [Lentisphaerae bacterium RIFOXYA12_64_32]OGV89132.1 MAG: glucose-inhibited division protein A [Lentisphaerae bacterium RIFOXYB12_FULL_65_16]
MAHIHESARDIPVLREVDVVVCGGGPAGVAAALAAARAGAKTALVELHGCLGGIWTAGMLCWIIDYANKTGIMAEILQRLEDRGARTFEPNGHSTNAYDVEEMKCLLDDLCGDAGVDIHLHTRVVGALRDASNRLTHAITESKSGREVFSAKVFIDCTGDGDLAAHAGCGFDFGHPEDGRTQPMSLMALITGVQAADIRPFYREGAEGWGPPKERLKAEMERGGHSPSYARPTLFRIREDLFALMANHEYGVKALDARDITAATLRARRELRNLINGLRSLDGVWQNVRLVATAAQIGLREGRRIHGRYSVTADDLRTGARHADAVCRCTFGIDVHATDPSKGKAIEAHPFQSQPYDIPLRALIARDVDGLLMAGRCICGDFLAHSSYRVTGDSVALGEAAGRTAARAALTNRPPHEVPWEEVKADR